MPDNQGATGCMPCAQRTKIAMMEMERNGRGLKADAVNFEDLPPVKMAVTWVYSIIGGIPVSYPVCMEHLVIQSKLEV